jgi:hypothetical protein
MNDTVSANDPDADHPASDDNLGTEEGHQEAIARAARAASHRQAGPSGSSQGSALPPSDQSLLVWLLEDLNLGGPTSAAGDDGTTTNT